MMASLKLLFGWIPSTSKIEETEKALVTEYEKLNTFSQSETLKKYSDLKELVTSSDFLRKKKEIESLNYKDSEIFSREKEFNSMVKSKEMTLYFKTLASSELKDFQKMDGSGKIADFEKLGEEINSFDFKQKMKSKEFKGSADSKKLEEYKYLRKSDEIKGYYKFKKSKAYTNFLNIDGSAKLSRFNELKELVESADFKKEKEYLTDKKRFEKTEMFKQLEEYNFLAKDADIIWYFKTKDSNKFDELKSRKLTFSDEFDGTSLNTKVWLTNYYWGDKLLHDRYSVESDLQSYTESGNFEVKNSVLKIITKPQKVTGKVWSAKNGFSTKEFAFTSGIINSATSFRQKYGTFKAKVKLGDPNTKNAFWMISDKITPHIDVCRSESGKVSCNLFPAPGEKIKAIIGAKYAGDFFIYSLEWSADKLVWKINDTVIKTVTTKVPQEPMYVVFSGGLDKPISGMTTMEIDWIRVYEQ